MSLPGLQHSLAHRPLLDRYFRSDVDPRETQVVLRRVATCSACRRRYERQLLFERVRPDGDDLRANRLWEAIRQSAGATVTSPPPARPTPSRHRVWVTAAFAAVGAMVLLVGGPYLLPGRQGADPVPRGAGDNRSPPPAIHLYRSTPDNRTERVGKTISASDGILVAYSNPAPELRYLLVFAVDDKKRLHWYYPPYQSLGVDPAAIPVRSGAVGVELGEEIRHSLEPGPLRVFAAFLATQRHVLETEALVQRALDAQAGPATAVVELPIPGATVTSLLLEVMP